MQTYELVMIRGRPAITMNPIPGRIIWTKHALEEIPLGLTHRIIEEHLRKEDYLFMRSKKEGEYIAIMNIHGTFLFLPL